MDLPRTFQKTTIGTENDLVAVGYARCVHTASISAKCSQKLPCSVFFSQFLGRGKFSRNGYRIGLLTGHRCCGLSLLPSYGMRRSIDEKFRCCTAKLDALVAKRGFFVEVNDIVFSLFSPNVGTATR